MQPKLTDTVSLYDHAPNEWDMIKRRCHGFACSYPHLLAWPLLFWWRVQSVTPEWRWLVGCGGGPGYGLASLTPRSNQLSQLACLCPPGKFYHPLSPRLLHPTHQSSLRNKNACEHAVEMPGNDTWQMLAFQHSVLVFHKGRNATLESQVLGSPHSWLQQSSVRVSL